MTINMLCHYQIQTQPVVDSAYFQSSFSQKSFVIFNSTFVTTVAHIPINFVQSLARSNSL